MVTAVPAGTVARQRIALVLISAMALSEMGNLAAVAAVAVSAVAKGLPSYLGLVLASQSLPVILLSRWVPKAIGGWGVSWWRRLLLLQATVFVLLAMHPSNLRLIVAGVAVVGIAEAFLVPFSRAVLGELSGPDGAPRLARRWGVAKSFAGAVGFLLAGWLIQESSVGWVFVANAVTFVVMACAAVVAPGTPVERSAEASTDAASAETRSLLEGFRQLAGPHVFSGIGFFALASILLATSLESVSGPFVVGGYSGYTPVHLSFAVGAWPVMATLSSLLLPEKWGARRGTFIVGACSICGGLIWIAVANSWASGLVGFAVAGTGNGIVNIALSAAIWGDVPSGLQRAAWSAFNFTLAWMLIAGFSIGSAAGASRAPEVVLAGGGVALVIVCVYVAWREYARRRWIRGA